MKLDPSSAVPASSPRGKDRVRDSEYWQAGKGLESQSFDSLIAQPEIGKPKEESSSDAKVDSGVEPATQESASVAMLLWQNQQTPAQPPSPLGIPSTGAPATEADLEVAPPIQSITQISARGIQTQSTPVHSKQDTTMGKQSELANDAASLTGSEEFAGDASPQPILPPDGSHVAATLPDATGVTDSGETALLSPAENMSGQAAANVAVDSFSTSREGARRLPSFPQRLDAQRRGESPAVAGTDGAKALRGMMAKPEPTTFDKSTQASAEGSLTLEGLAQGLKKERFAVAEEPAMAAAGNEAGPLGGDLDKSMQSTFSIRATESVVNAPLASSAPMQANAPSSARFDPFFRAIGDVAEKMRHEGPGKVEIDLHLDNGERVRVRLELREGFVSAAFQTETGDFQHALQQGWTNFSQQSSEKGMNLTQATFDTATLDQELDFAGRQDQRERANDGSGTKGQGQNSGNVRRSDAATSTPATSADSSSVSLWA